MAKVEHVIQNFNRGVISPLALARSDIKRTGLSAETQTNFFPRVLGSMMLRPGLEYKGTTRNNAQAVHIPFIFSTLDLAEIELTANNMRVKINDAVITRPAITTTMSNGTFSADLTGWTAADEVGTLSDWITGGYMGLRGNGYSRAVRTRMVPVTGGNIGVEHALRIIVSRGEVTLRVGTGSTVDDYVSETVLGVGEYSIAFIANGNFYINVSSKTRYFSLIDKIELEAAGEMLLPTSWGNSDLANIRWTQSGDVVYCASGLTLQQKKIERRSARSWAIVDFSPKDGPFRNINNTAITLTPSATYGDITLTSSRDLFKTTHVGALFKMEQTGRLVNGLLSGDDQFTDEIRVSGVSGQRYFTFTIDGVWTGTITLQRSVSAPGDWIDVKSYSSSTTVSNYDDNLDNQIVYYRLGFKTGGYGSGLAVVTVSYVNGTSTGIVKVTSYINTQQVEAIVLNDLGNVSPTSDWYEGAWSGRRGYPSAVGFFEGRLFWAGKDKINGSVSDAYESYDDDVEGDSGPISRSIGFGPVDRINWILPLVRMVVGTEGAELTVMSSSFDEPLTPTNFGLKSASNQGSAAVPAVAIDSDGVYAQRNGTRLFMLKQNENGYHESLHLTELTPEICEPGIVRIAVQRQPDTRIHVVRSDGKVAIMVSSKAEDVSGFILFETDGVVEDAWVLPGTIEDKVKYLVRRTINGQTRRFIEQYALERDCQGGTLNKQADSFVTYSGASTNIIPAAHLEGKQVIVWADGKDFSPDDGDGVQTLYTVTGGVVTLGQNVTNAVVGLPYAGQYKSVKLAYASEGGGLLKTRKINHCGLVLHNTHNRALKYGGAFDRMDRMPLEMNGATVGADEIWSHHDESPFEFDGVWNTDSRLCLEATAPRPATILALAAEIEVHA